MTTNTLTLLAGVSLAVSSALANNGSALPVRELSAAQKNTLTAGGAYASVPLAPLSTAAMVEIESKNGSTRSVQRKSGDISAVYGQAVLPGSGVSGGPATGGAPPATGLDFKKTGDSARGWATMRTNGSPFLAVSAFGQASASSTSSFTTKYTMPAGKNVFLGFVMPSFSLGGAHESEGPSRRASRLRVDVMLNGAPVWSSESNRTNLLNGTPSGSNCVALVHKTNFLSTFERPMTGAAPETVFLDLGAFSAGQTLELTFVVRLDANSRDKCCKKQVDGVDELFCSSATGTVSWDGTATPVSLYTGPAMP